MSFLSRAAGGRRLTSLEHVASHEPGSSADAIVVEVRPPSRNDLPVLRPLLPTAEAVFPYLRRIDASRIYSNFGPLAAEFAERLSASLGVSPEHVVPASCGTSALIAGILAAAGTATATKPLAILPAFTFAATAIAVERCGYEPYLVDVDQTDWALDPRELAAHPQLSRTGVVVPVAPFGRPVAQQAWIEFRERTGIPVVIDAAASFACIEGAAEDYVGPLPIALSFHATKAFGIGEGGCAITTDDGLSRGILRALNFGFHGNRDSAVPSINGKMSEYHAAVGLAAHDGWGTRREVLRRVARVYRVQFAALGAGDRFFGFPDVDGAYALYKCADAVEAARVQSALKAAGIDYRFWYDKGLHRHTHFLGGAGDELPVTDELGEALIGLPMSPDLEWSSIERIVEAVASVFEA